MLCYFIILYEDSNDNHFHEPIFKILHAQLSQQNYMSFHSMEKSFSLVHCSASKCLCVSAAVQVQLSYGWPFDNNIYILIPIFCRGCTQSVVSNHNAEISSSVNLSLVQVHQSTILHVLAWMRFRYVPKLYGNTCM